ncbi:uncharacterized protein BYT42DRAFT_609781 [Radiomyces spectabilis]|uniref:uncharacterized protein n=1 Tax=Radiomyces spectabilis TaxID=64574 RepID=UPI00222082D2|nr:uncharacterized protein BYT42DRAFT_609781 [Radiomyces spectabilis]KAI8394021.1 hypothetical protein BYT42DRAFT_609781 [Radiomyces spectabilis]
MSYGYKSRNEDYEDDSRTAPVESFVVFGTAFPEQTEKDRRAGVSDAGQFVPVWKQEARDEKGRRRFHGAFTGGFSAGYFNTVGSKEGWQPSNFVSSRSSRNQQRELRPEDFMDEEDLQELADARKLVATEEFDILGGTEKEMAARRQQQQEDEARGGTLGFLGSSLMNLIGPSKDSVGIKLLRKMGWKPGQGIGPRLSQKQKRDLGEDEEEDDDDAMLNVTFAPRDTPIVDFTNKTNAHGLGYDIEKYVPQVAEMRRLRDLKGSRETDETFGGTQRSAFGVLQGGGAGGFGVGTFEDEDEDMDVYGDSKLRDYHHSLYDDDMDQDREITSTKRRHTESKDDNVSKKRCTDGRYPLKGFIVSIQAQQLGKWYPPPTVPADFDERKSVISVEGSTAVAAPQYGLTSDERGAMLGEKPIEARSVFDYMPQRSKDQLDTVLKFVIDSGKDRSKLADFPTITKEVANLALRGFMPYGDNPNKQGRYRAYLENQAGLLSEDGIPKDSLPIPEGLTYEQGMKELDEFAKAARIFRPVSAMMQGRFASARGATSTLDQPSSMGGLKTESEWRKEKEEREKHEVKAPQKELSQEAQAAAMKMFGQLTRKVKPFYPARLVCKRFNVRNPHPHHDPNASAGDLSRTQAGSREALSEQSMEHMLKDRVPAPPKPIEHDPALSAVIPKPSERTKDNAEQAPTDVGIPQTTPGSMPPADGPALDYERPSMDIFKAIFENSEDEDEEEQDYEAGALAETGVSAKQSSTAPSSTAMEEEEDDDFVGPPLPPPPEPEPKSEPAQPFRPMFILPTERNKSSTGATSSGMPSVVSEEIVVQPFRSRTDRDRLKRRHVSVSDEESREESEEEEDHDDRRRHSRSRSKHRKRSRSRERHHKKDKKKKKDKHRHKHKRSSSRRHASSDEEDTTKRLIEEAEWVEKEPSTSLAESRREKPKDQGGDSSHRQRQRMRAVDFW